MARSKITNQIIAGLAGTMSLGGAGFGFGWPSPSLPKLLGDNDEIKVTSDEGSWIVSVFTIGSAVGSLVGSLGVNKYGRKWLLLSTIIPYLIAALLLGAAQNVWWYIIGRIISGFGTGIGYSVVPMYAGEIADDRIRGAVSGLLDPVVNVAVVLMYCIGPWVSLRDIAIVGGVLPLVFGVIFVWMPESPYYLIMKKKLDQAEKSLIWLRGTDDVSEELEQLQQNIQNEEKNSGQIIDLLMIPGNRRALIIVVGIMAAQQFSGISAIVSYSSLIFEASGASMDPSISVIVIGVVQMLAGVLTAFTADLAGRRVLMLFSTYGSVVCLVGVAIYYQLQAAGIDVSSISWLPLVCLIGFIVICTLGLGALPYVILSELFPCNVKALAIMVANVSCSLLAVVSTKLYQIVADAYGIHYSFWGFAVLSIFMGLFIYFTLPETKQRSLQDIQDELHKTTESKTVLNEL